MHICCSLINKNVIIGKLLLNEKMFILQVKNAFIQKLTDRWRNRLYVLFQFLINNKSREMHPNCFGTNAYGSSENRYFNSILNAQLVLSRISFFPIGILDKNATDYMYLYICYSHVLHYCIYQFSLMLNPDFSCIRYFLSSPTPARG